MPGHARHVGDAVTLLTLIMNTIMIFTTLWRRTPKTMEIFLGMERKRPKLFLARIGAISATQHMLWATKISYERTRVRRMTERDSLMCLTQAPRGSAVQADVDASQENEEYSQSASTGKRPLNAYVESASESNHELSGPESVTQKEPSASVESDQGSGAYTPRKDTDSGKASGVDPKRDHERNNELKESLSSIETSNSVEEASPVAAQEEIPERRFVLPGRTSNNTNDMTHPIQVGEHEGSTIAGSDEDSSCRPIIEHPDGTRIRLKTSNKKEECHISGQRIELERRDSQEEHNSPQRSNTPTHLKRGAFAHLREAKLGEDGLSPWAYLDGFIINHDGPPNQTFRRVMKDGEEILVEEPEPMASEIRWEIEQSISGSAQQSVDRRPGNRISKTMTNSPVDIKATNSTKDRKVTLRRVASGEYLASEEARRERGRLLTRKEASAERAARET